MAEEAVLLKVNLDASDMDKSEKAIIAARNEITRLKEANDKLAKSEGDKTKEILKNEIQIKNQSNIVRENTRVLVSNEKTNRSNAGSIAEMRESVKRAQAEYVKLSKEERENTKVGGVLQKSIKAQNDELKELEKQIGVTGRNVGNYKDEVSAALLESGLFNKAQAAMAAAQKAVAAAAKISAIATRSFGSALIATGIGAILVLFGSLVGYLTQTQGGMDAVARVTARVGTFISVLTDAFSKLGGQLFDEIIPTLKSFGKIITGILTLDLGQIKEGFNGIKESVNNIDPVNLVETTKAAAAAGDEADKLTKKMQDLVREEKQLDLARAQGSANIEKLRAISEDMTKSQAERTKAAQDALAIEQELEQKQIDLQQQKVDIIKQQNALSESTDEDNNKLIDAEIELSNLQAASGRKQIALIRKVNTLQKSGVKEAIKNVEEVDEVTTAAIINQEKLLKEQIAGEVEATNNKIRDLINLEKERFVNGELDFQEYQENLANIEAMAFELKLATLQEQLLETQNNLLIDADERFKIESDLQEKIKKLDDQVLDNDVKNSIAVMNAKKETDLSIVQSAEDRASAEFEALNNVLNLTKTVFGESSAAGKAAASFQVLMDTFVGARAAFNSQIVKGDPTSIFRAAIAAAVTSATGLAQVAKINSKPTPKFADGGGIEVAGPSHSGGGVDVALGGQTVANVEGGEGLFVMKRDAFQSLKGLSDYNQMFGGNSWFGGGKKILADGGAIVRGSAPQLDRRSLQDAQTGISDSMQQIKVIAKVTDINRVNDEMNIVEMQGDLR